MCLIKNQIKLIPSISKIELITKVILFLKYENLYKYI